MKIQRNLTKEDFNLYNPLIAGIISASVYDYIYASKGLKILEKEGANVKSREFVKLQQMKVKSETFLKSDWFKEITSHQVSAEYLIETCDKAVALEKYGTIKKAIKNNKQKEYKYVFCLELITAEELAGLKGVVDKKEYARLEYNFKHNIPTKKNIAQHVSARAEKLILDILEQ